MASIPSVSDSEAQGFEPGRWWRTRSYKTSARLHLQHWLFQNTIGFVLHPDILANIQNSLTTVRVADIGCGNGVWLSELNRFLALNGMTKTELHGFDINPVNFPAPALLPSNVRLSVQDMLSDELPAELVGVFDVVHVRAFGSCIEWNDTRPLLKNLVRMLKPGGWLQWDESRSSHMAAYAPDESTTKEGCDALLRILHEGGKLRGTLWDWLDQFPVHFKEHGLGTASVQQMAVRAEDSKAWTEDYLMVYEELVWALPTKAQAPDYPFPREAFSEALEKVIKETEQGVVMHQGSIVVAVAQNGMS